MKRFFQYDGPFFRFLWTAAELIGSNFLCVLCCTPIVTAGAALAAHHKLMQNLVLQNPQPLLKTYFSAMWSNWKQATVLWFLSLLATAILVADIYCIFLLTEGIFAILLCTVLCLIYVLLLGVFTCCYALIVRYENKLGEHIRNALFLFVQNRSRMLCVAMSAAIPLLSFLFFSSLTAILIPWWLFIGLSLLTYLQTYLIKPIFNTLG